MKSLFPLVQSGFIILTIVFYTWLLIVIKRALARTSLEKQVQQRIVGSLAVGVVVWAAVTGALANTGFFQDFSSVPPKFLIVLLIPLVAILWLTSRPVSAEILKHIAPEKMLYMQGFRIVVEILLWMLFLDNLLPVQMTFEGRNWDIIAGLTGPIIGYLFYKGIIPPTAVKIWNGLCLLLLVNIVTIAILSTPVPFRVFMNEPANTIVMTFPAIWLPALLVPLAYMLHILSWKQMSLPERKGILQSR